MAILLTAILLAIFLPWAVGFIWWLLGLYESVEILDDTLNIRSVLYLWVRGLIIIIIFAAIIGFIVVVIKF